LEKVTLRCTVSETPELLCVCVEYLILQHFRTSFFFIMLLLQQKKICTSHSATDAMHFLTCCSIRHVVTVRIMFEDFVLSSIRSEITSMLLLYTSQIRKRLLFFGKWMCTRPKRKVMEGHAELCPKERTFCHRTSSSLFCKKPWLCPP